MDYIVWNLVTDILDGTAEGADLFLAHPMFESRLRRANQEVASLLSVQDYDGYTSETYREDFPIGSRKETVRDI